MVTVGSWGVRARRAGAGVLVAVAAAGCSAQSGAAAVVEGRSIPVADLQAATRELGPFLPEATPAQVLLLLVAEPTFAEIAADNGIGVSDAEARAVLDDLAASAGTGEASEGGTTEFGDASLAVARLTILQQRLQQLPDADAVVEEVSAQLADLDVEVNPRYGRIDFDGGAGIVPVDHPWIVAAPAS